jgi:Amino acid kinase family
VQGGAQETSPGRPKMCVVALGGNALLKRGEPLTMENQSKNAREAAAAIASLVKENGYALCVTHGNGPQVGLLAQQVRITSPCRASALLIYLSAVAPGRPAPPPTAPPTVPTCHLSVNLQSIHPRVSPSTWPFACPSICLSI